MKLRVFPLALGMIGLATGLASAKNGWRMVETTRVLSSAGAHADFIVEKSSSSENSPRVHIAWNGRTALTVQSEGGLVRVADAVDWGPGLPPNRLASKWVYSPKLPGRAGTDLYLIFGESFASDPGSLRIVRIRADGKPLLVYSDETFQVQAIVQGAGGLELVGRRSFSQETGKCRSTYDPFTVLVLSRNEPPRASDALSRDYNLSHWYVWAGPKAREDIEVDTCAKPARIVGGSAGNR